MLNKLSWLVMMGVSGGIESSRKAHEISVFSKTETERICSSVAHQFRRACRDAAIEHQWHQATFAAFATRLRSSGRRELTPPAPAAQGYQVNPHTRSRPVALSLRR